MSAVLGVLALVAIVTEQLIGFSCHCRLGNVSNACSEVPTGFATLLQYGSLEVILTESRIESHNCFNCVMFVLLS